jgi:hypothetical protein
MPPNPPDPPFAASPSPPPSTQARHAAPTRRPIDVKRGAATRHGKPTLVKKTAIDRFNDSRQDESRRLNLKRKMEHDEKMASIRLKRHKYDLRYGSIPHTPGSSTPLLVTRTAQAAATTKEDKQIEILRLQIRLAELTQVNTAHPSSYASSSRSRSSSSQAPLIHDSLENCAGPSGSGLSYCDDPSGRRSHNRFSMTAELEDTGYYHVDGEASSSTVGADMTSSVWPETYNFAAS